MPVDKSIADEQWFRYVYLRDNGHLDFIEKANICDANYMGNQWRVEDKAALEAQRRPALTINKVLPTVDTIVGEQIQQRIDIAFKQSKPGGEDISEVFEQLFRIMFARNQYPWKETEVYEDGLITSRGWFDVRLGFTNNMKGEVQIAVLNPRNVLPDCDAEEYDTDTWADVCTTKWLCPLDIEVLYNKDDADYLAHTDPAFYSQEFDSVFRSFETFRSMAQYRAMTPGQRELRRDIRVIERQFRMSKKLKMLVDLKTGDMREIPEGWDREKIGFVMQNYGLGVTEIVGKKIRWRVTAGNCVLHDDWSPYEHFTPVPYFPHFRRGKTIGAVENLLGPQEYLNKTTSQELHVINTTANSGWKVKTGALRNMSMQELEIRGAQTGLVMELSDVKDAEKITPNQIPTGLDRMSFKAEEYIKSISTVTDNAQGMDREDVASKAIKAKREVNVVSRAKIIDNLNRTRWMLVRNAVSIVQRYYTEPRMYKSMADDFAPPGESQPDLGVNQWDEAAGRIVNDLTLGEYEFFISTVPQKDSAMESEFEQLAAMRKDLGVQIPDEVLIMNSNARSKRQLLKALTDQKNSPEAQNAAAVTQQAQQLELQQKDADISQTQADAALKTANAKARIAEVQAGANAETQQGENPELAAAQMEHEAAQSAEQRAHDAAQKEADRAHEDHKEASKHARAVQLKGMEMAHQDAQTAQAQQHEQFQTAQTQQHEQGMARLGHAQKVVEGSMSHSQQKDVATLGHKHKVAEIKAAPKKPATKEKK
jgi:hypothetical protein